MPYHLVAPLAWHRLSGLDILLRIFPHWHQRLPQLADEVAGYIEGHVQSEDFQARGAALCVRIHLIHLVSLSKRGAKKVESASQAGRIVQRILLCPVRVDDCHLHG